VVTGAEAPGSDATVATILGIAAACWAVAIWRMHGMDMGAATAFGSLGSFVGLWVPMMAAMMLPGAVPAVLSGGRVGRVASFLGSYLAVWSLVGVVLFALYRPHGTSVAGGVVLAAGFYELTRSSVAGAGAAARGSTRALVSAPTAWARASG
jgi:predicted metal-binding membrane protein